MMKQTIRLLFFGVMASFLSVARGSAQQRQVVNLNYDWEFSRDSLFTVSAPGLPAAKLTLQALQQ